MELVEKYKSKFQEFEATLNGQKVTATHIVRQQAFQTFEQLGIPSSKNERYKYTNLNPLFGKGFEPIVKPIKPTIAKLQTFPFIKSNRLVFIDGLYSEQYSHIIDKNIEISNLQQEFKKGNETVAQYFSTIANYDNESLVALNTAFANDGAFIHVPENVVVENPVLLIYLTSGNNENGIAQPRNLFVIEKN